MRQKVAVAVQKRLSGEIMLMMSPFQAARHETIGHQYTIMFNTAQNPATPLREPGTRRGGSAMKPDIWARWHRRLKALAFSLFGIALVVSLCSCRSSAILGPAVSSAEIAAQYRLAPGDKIRLTVFNQPNLSSDYTVDGGGYISLPLVGPMKAGDQTTHQLEQEIAQELVSRGFLVNPNVTIQIPEFRPYYILGEISAPGTYPYVANLTVIKAVAAAHGYTYRANVHRVYIQRSGENSERLYEVTPGTAVLPGDTIRIPERRF
jgi:protein involved in polysaccharide export with SLBB domain